MKTFLLACLISSSVLQLASAKIPEKAPKVKYTGLWTNSPFTSKPIVEPTGPTANILDDYTLTGIAPVPGGYRITIMNKKNPEMKEVIEPGGSSQFKVVSVNRNPDKALGTTVVLTSSLSSGSIQGTVSFEPELITLKAAPAAAPQAQQGNLPPGITPAMAGQQGAVQVQTQNGNGDIRQPRPRIVPPPAPTQGGAGNVSRGAAPVNGDPRKIQGNSRDNNSQPRTQHRR